MRVLVVHGSRMGSTREIAERIAGQLRASGFEADAVAAADRPDPSVWDAFVVGAGVYAGHWHSDAAAFVRDNRRYLAERPVWLFSSGPVGPSATTHEPAEPKEIGQFRTLIQPRDHRTFGGAFDRANIDQAGMGKADRFIAARFIPEGDFREWGQIEAWAVQIAHELRSGVAVRVTATRDTSKDPS